MNATKLMKRFADGMARAAERGQNYPTDGMVDVSYIRALAADAFSDESADVQLNEAVECFLGFAEGGILPVVTADGRWYLGQFRKVNDGSSFVLQRGDDMTEDDADWFLESARRRFS